MVRDHHTTTSPLTSQTLTPPAPSPPPSLRLSPLPLSSADELGNFYYGPSHPMKPHRIRMAHNLVLAYGLYKKLEIYRPTLMSEEQMTKFHADDYIHFLQHVTPDNQMDYSTELTRYNLDVDCFPEDHQLLTERGFMSLDDLLHHREAHPSSPVRMATFNAVTQTIEYQPHAAILVKEGTHSMVDFAQPEEADVWDGPCGPSGKLSMTERPHSPPSDRHHVALRVTASHDMFVLNGGVESSSPWQKVKAESLVSSDPLAVAQFRARASRGVDHHLPAGALLPFQAPLGLHTEDQCEVFMWLYGYFLGNGKIIHNQSTGDALLLGPVRTEGETLQAILSRLGLVDRVDYLTVTEENSKGELLTCISIQKRSWFDYFHGAHGPESVAEEVEQRSEESAKRFRPWVLTHCSTSLVQQLINGLWAAANGYTQGEREIRTSCALTRDLYVQVLLHAGYSAHFEAKNGGWSVRHSEEESTAEPTLVLSRDVKRSVYEGRVWCVTVPNGLLIARRAAVETDGTVTAASRPVVVGNCPVFDGMFKFCQMYTGGSVGGAYKLNRQTADICINWYNHTHTTRRQIHTQTAQQTQ